MELEGLGANIWKGLDAQDYVRKERESWDYVDLRFVSTLRHLYVSDAIQMAVGIIYGADAFLTNDSSLKKVNDIRVVILEDFLEK